MPNVIPQSYLLDPVSRALADAGAPFWLSLPISSATADGAVLFTNPISIDQTEYKEGTDGSCTLNGSVLTTAAGGITGSDWVGGTLRILSGPNVREYLISGTPTATTISISGAFDVAATNLAWRLKRAPAPKIVLTGAAVRDLDLVIKVSLAGARSAAQFDWSEDGGATYTTGVAMAAGAVALGTTGLTANFPDASLYATTNKWVMTAPTRRLAIIRAAWDVRTAFTGGTASAIGLSTSMTGFNTRGDLLGGATGDVEATLVAGLYGGTLGAKFASNGFPYLGPGATIKFDRINSAFTGGSGYVQLLVTSVPRI